MGRTFAIALLIPMNRFDVLRFAVEEIDSDQAPRVELTEDYTSDQ